MIWVGGLIPIIYYGSVGGSVIAGTFLITQSGIPILTQDSKNILVSL